MSCFPTNTPTLTISLPAAVPRGSPTGVYATNTTPLLEYSIGSQASYENSIRGLRSNSGFNPKDSEMGPSLRRQVVRVGTSTVVTPIATPTIRNVSPLPFLSSPSTPITVTVGLSIRRNDPYRPVIATEYSEELHGENAARGIPVMEHFAFTAYSYFDSQTESESTPYYSTMLHDSYYASQAPAGMDPQFLEYSVSTGYMDDQSNSGESVGHVLTSAEVTPKKPKTADLTRKPEKKKNRRISPTTQLRTDMDDSNLFPQEPVPELPEFVRSIVSPSQQSGSTPESGAPLQRVYYNGRPVPVRATMATQ